MNKTRSFTVRGCTSKGFTLLEVLVALSIFALVSAIAFRGLNLIMDTRARVTEEGRKWQDLSRLYVRMKQDLSMTVNRPVRDSRDLPATAVSGDPNPVGEDNALISVTRSGLAGQQGSLQGLQRFGYRLRGDKVEMLSWPVLDQAPRSRPVADELMGGVASMDAKYLDAGGLWQDRWPMPGHIADLPVAVKVSLVLASGEQIMWQFALR